MLTELRIRNLAVIDELVVRLGPGLTVLTGETGAGKSIIVGALSLLLGERASTEAVRAGADRASVEGIFDLSGRVGLLAALDERGVEVEDGLLVLKREVAVEGRNRAWINGGQATAGLVGEVGRLLVDLHGQHEHQTLLSRGEQREILDAFGGHAELAGEVRALHAEHAALAERRRELDRREAEVRERADLLRFQCGEIEEAAPRADEEEEIEAEARRLSHSEELLELSARLGQVLEDPEGEGVAVRLGALRRDVERLAELDRDQAELTELFDTAYYALEELGSRLASYGEGVEHDPARLDALRRRQDLLFRLKRKYGPTLEEVIAHGERTRAELDGLDRSAFEREALDAELARVREALAAASGRLTAVRREAGEGLAGEVEEILPDLGMPDGRFETALIPREETGASGAEEVEFRVSLNRGFAPRPLRRVASGGELSRVMLALKTILARLDAVPTLVFDEVDAGIGGEVARRVGGTMRRVASEHQVFAISHLPQIASQAHGHCRVRKAERDGVAATEIRWLEGEERVRELARMLGGDAEREVSLEHAREMLAGGD